MASLADRITKPDGEQGKDEVSAVASVPPPVEQTESTSWADEASLAADAASTSSTTKSGAEKDMSNLAGAQTDGAGEPNGGTNGIVEPSYNVNIKLADLQANPDDPLYSVKSFEELGL